MARLAIDHGWDMGWCLERGGNLTSGVQNFRRLRGDGLRLLAMRDWWSLQLSHLAKTGETLDAIYYEWINFHGRDNSVDAPHAHGKQLGALESWCALKKLPEPIGLQWDKVKVHVTGHRSAAREKMLEVVRGGMPEVSNHNQASAVAVMLTGLNRRFDWMASPPARKSRK